MRYFCIIYMLPKSKSGEKCHNFVHNEHLTLHKLGNSEKMLNFAFQNYAIRKQLLQKWRSKNN